MYKTKTTTQSVTRTAIQKKTTIISKKKRKDTRKGIQQEANRLIAAKAERYELEKSLSRSCSNQILSFSK